MTRALAKKLIALGVFGWLAGCGGEPRAVVLPLQYPDGSFVTTKNGDPLIVGYQTEGDALHANATALWENARSPNCVRCGRLGAVVSEPSTLRQATGVLSAATFGAGSVMTGVGMMNYGDAAGEGKLGTNINQEVNQRASLTASQSNTRTGLCRDPHTCTHFGGN